MTKLVKITKTGEPELKVHPDALDQHHKLGWKTSEQQDEEDAAGGEGDGTGETGILASKNAVKHAEENGIDLKTVKGTGTDGAITKGDVQKAIDELAVLKKAE